MNNRRLALLAVLVSIAAIAICAGKPDPARDPYTPTRQEWAVVMLNCRLGASLTQAAPCGVRFIAGEKGSVVMDFSYRPRADRAHELVCATVEKMAVEILKGRGWEDIDLVVVLRPIS